METLIPDTVQPIIDSVVQSFEHEKDQQNKRVDGIESVLGTQIFEAPPSSWKQRSRGLRRP